MSALTCVNARIAGRSQNRRPGSRQALLAGLLAFVPAAILLGLDGFPSDARAVIAIFAATVIAWVFSTIDDTTVVLIAVLALPVSGALPSARVYAALGHELVWLLIASFMIAVALKSTGLTERLIARALRGVRTVRHLFVMLTLAIAATAFVIPSTSGRAAMLLPIYLALATAINNARVTRALALLFPTVILLSACGSLIGAGAHVVAVDMIERLGHGPAPGYLKWMALALPFALISSLGSMLVILHLFLTAAERRLQPPLSPAPDGPMTPAQRHVGTIVVVTVAMWATKPLHGVDLALTALAAAVLVTLGGRSGLSLKDAIKAVEWTLILFLAATLLLTEALIDTNAAALLFGAVIERLRGPALADPVVVTAIVSLVALLAHLIVVSRTARAAILIPMIAIPLSQAGHDASSIILLIVVGTGFCQTMSASAKPVALFAVIDRPGYGARDLARLSLALLPLHFVLLMLFALKIWPLVGRMIAG